MDLTSRSTCECEQHLRQHKNEQSIPQAENQGDAETSGRTKPMVTMSSTA